MPNTYPSDQSYVASSILSNFRSLPTDIKQIYLEQSAISNESLLFKETSCNLDSIKLFLESHLKELCLDPQSLEKNSMYNHISEALLSSTKNFGLEFYPPILEETLFSLTKHFFFNYRYLLSASRELSSNPALEYSKELSFFVSNGYIIVNNFFAENELGQLKDMFAKHRGSLSKDKNTLMYSNSFAKTLLGHLLSESFLSFLSLLTGYSTPTLYKEICTNTFLQSVDIPAGFTGDDPQQNFHLDTFYPAFKFWIFPDDVLLDSGPFEYVPKSHMPTKRIYKHLQDGYLSNAYNSNYSISSDHAEGSLRATSNDIIRMGLSPKRISVKANSLVVANVGGFHRRSLAKKHVTRHAIHSSIRPKAIYNVKTYRSL